MNPFLFFSSAILCSSLSIAQITPPAQPATGPGGSNYLYSSYDSTRYGTNITDMYWLFEPNDISPPDSVPVIALFHGMTSETDSTKVPFMHLELIHHIVKKGYTVVYPLYQYDGFNHVLTPPSYQWSVSAGIINDAIAELESGIHVKPKRDSNGKVMLGITGYSKGGGMSMDLAKYYNTYNLPKFDAVAAFVASGSGTTSIGNIPSDTKIIMVLGSDDTYPVAPKDTIIAVYNALSQISCGNKNFIELNSDNLGTPTLIADHHFYVADPLTPSSINALDYFGSWKLCVATFNCAFYGTDCDYAFGNGNNVIFMGNWSNGTPVNPITVLDTCNVSSVINYNDVSFQIQIYPNPFSYYTILQSDNLLNNATLTIENYLGQTVAEIKNINEQSITLHRDNLPSGLYFIRLTENNKIIVTKKLIVTD